MNNISISARYQGKVNNGIVTITKILSYDVIDGKNLASELAKLKREERKKKLKQLKNVLFGSL